MQHIFQPNGFSCGPTCIKMVANYLRKGEEYSIDDITKFCETDTTIGTPPNRMQMGMNKLRIAYKINHGFEELDKALSRNDVCILRTFTNQVPHWIIVYDYENITKEYKVNDPWLGRMEYTHDELEKIWMGREYFFYDIPTNQSSSIFESFFKKKTKFITCNKIADYKIKGLKILIEAFQNEPSELLEWAMNECDPNISFFCMLGNKLIGIYCLRARNLPETGENEGDDFDGDFIKYKSYKKYEHKKGLEGIALALLPSYQGNGYGKKMIEKTYSLGFDYVWGEQFKHLKNLQNWLTKRELVAEINPGGEDGIYFTARMI